MGVGGVFDVMAGNLRRAPLWMRNHRLEWAYRLYLQPSRIGRMAAIPKFMLAIKNGKGKTEIKYAEKPIILPEGYPFIIISLIVAALLWYFGMLYTAVIPFVFSCYFVISSVAPEEMRSSRRGKIRSFPRLTVP